MGLYALCGMESDRRLRNMAKNFMVTDINRTSAKLLGCLKFM